LDLSNGNKWTNAAEAVDDVAVEERPISIDIAETVVAVAAIVSVDVSQPPPRTSFTSNLTGSKSRKLRSVIPGVI
jgi:hypothetical protein